ncbi:hypothetical protein Anapl_00165 [Anas platyrhynchos]|uniref:Uncharacterized protein n=1 Tax=Anas platyrhynchos TaxID=8839 RepID=R0LEV9_ANAPL|nr:hypothetical protein Anapl_00165 [Anas platyrhynchos]
MSHQGCNCTQEAETMTRTTEKDGENLPSLGIPLNFSDKTDNSTQKTNEFLKPSAEVLPGFTWELVGNKSVRNVRTDYEAGQREDCTSKIHFQCDTSTFSLISCLAQIILLASQSDVRELVNQTATVKLITPSGKEEIQIK